MEIAFHHGPTGIERPLQQRSTRHRIGPKIRTASALQCTQKTIGLDHRFAELNRAVQNAPLDPNPSTSGLEGFDELEVGLGILANQPDQTPEEFIQGPLAAFDLFALSGGKSPTSQ
jgi:hypothetical protein